jgi:DNA-binding MarR family transcriptional regulator
VTLTDKARDLLPALYELIDALEDQITAGLSAEERAVLLKLLQRLSAGAGLIPGIYPRLG